LVTTPRQKEVLAITDRHSLVAVRLVAGFCAEFSAGAIHLHDLLGCVWTSSEAIDNMKSDRDSFDYEPVTRSTGARKNQTTGASGDLSKAKLPITDRAAIKEAFPVREDSKSSHNNSPPGQPTRKVKGADQIWAGRRGHGLSFAALFLYTTLAYFRPYELSPSLAWTAWLPFSLAIVMLAIFIPTQLVLESNLTARPQEINLVGLLCLVALVSIPLAISPYNSWKTFTSVLLKIVIVFVVMINVLRTERRLNGMLFLAIVAALLMSASALTNMSEAGDIGARAKVNINNNMFGEPNGMALYLLTMMPIVIAWLMISRSLLKKIFWGACAFLMMAGVFATFSRGGFLGLMSAGVFLAWKLGRRHRLILAIGTMLVVIASVILIPSGYVNRLASIFDPTLDLVGSSSSRQALLIRSIAIALKRPIWGVGIGNFPLVSIHSQGTHNTYTQLASEMGILALVIYLAFVWVAFKRLRKVERETFAQGRKSRFYFLAIGLQASLVGYLVSSFFLHFAYEPNVYFLVACVVCFHELYKVSTKPLEGMVQGQICP
jgi:O-antigen ligase